MRKQANCETAVTGYPVSRRDAKMRDGEEGTGRQRGADGYDKSKCARARAHALFPGRQEAVEDESHFPATEEDEFR